VTSSLQKGRSQLDWNEIDRSLPRSGKAQRDERLVDELLRFVGAKSFPPISEVYHTLQITINPKRFERLAVSLQRIGILTKGVCVHGTFPVMVC
jgi:hypothetical protein